MRPSIGSRSSHLTEFFKIAPNTGLHGGMPLDNILHVHRLFLSSVFFNDYKFLFQATPVSSSSLASLSSEPSCHSYSCRPELPPPIPSIPPVSKQLWICYYLWWKHYYLGYTNSVDFVGTVEPQIQMFQ